MIAITFANRRRLSLRLLHVGTGKLLDKVRYLWPWCPKIGIVGPLLLNKDPVWNWSCWKSSLRNHGCYWKGWRVKGRGRKMFLRHGGNFFAENEKLEDVVWGFQELEREASSRWYNTLLLQFQNLKECCPDPLVIQRFRTAIKVHPSFRKIYFLFPKLGEPFPSSPKNEDLMVKKYCWTQMAERFPVLGGWLKNRQVNQPDTVRTHCQTGRSGP